MEKLGTCTRLSRKLRIYGDTRKPYHSTLVHQQKIGKTKNCCIYVVEAKIVTPRVKHSYITVCFIQEIFDNYLFVSKYENSSFMPEYSCTKPYSGPIIIRSNKWMIGLRLYPTSDT